MNMGYLNGFKSLRLGLFAIIESKFQIKRGCTSLPKPMANIMYCLLGEALCSLPQAYICQIGARKFFFVI